MSTYLAVAHESTSIFNHPAVMLAMAFISLAFGAYFIHGVGTANDVVRYAGFGLVVVSIGHGAYVILSNLDYWRGIANSPTMGLALGALSEGALIGLGIVVVMAALRPRG